MKGHHCIRLPVDQAGQAAAEFLVVAAFVLVPMVLGMTYLAKLGDSRHQMQEVARYATWERTVWSQSDPKLNSKSETTIRNEALTRVTGKPNLPIDSVRDGKNVKAKNRDFSAFLYVDQPKSGKRKPIFKANNGEYATVFLKNDKALKGTVANAVGKVAAFGLSLDEKGLQTSTVNWEYNWIPTLDFGLPKLQSTTHNTMLTASWNAGSPEQIKDTLKSVVATKLLGDSTVGKGLSKMLKLGFDDFKHLDLGKIDVDRVPCQRLTNVKGKGATC